MQIIIIIWKIVTLSCHQTQNCIGRLDANHAHRWIEVNGIQCSGKFQTIIIMQCSNGTQSQQTSIHWDHNAHEAIIMAIKSFCLVIWREIAAHKNQFNTSRFKFLNQSQRQIQSDIIHHKLRLWSVEAHICLQYHNHRQFNLCNRIS